MPKGESKQTLLGDGADGEDYVKHLLSFFWFMEKKGYEADLEVAAKVTLSMTTALKKLAKAQTGEKDPANIRSRKQDNNDGTSNIVLPCPGS